MVTVCIVRQKTMKKPNKSPSKDQWKTDITVHLDKELCHYSSDRMIRSVTQSPQDLMRTKPRFCYQQIIQKTIVKTLQAAQAY